MNIKIWVSWAREGELSYFFNGTNSVFEFDFAPPYSFGEVIKARKHIDGNLYAIKRSIRPVYSFHEKQDLLREVRCSVDVRGCIISTFSGTALQVHALSSIEESEHIVRYYTAWEEDNYIYVCNELMDSNANLFKKEFLSMTGRSHLPESVLIEILRHCLHGLRDLHEHEPSIAHLDIKPENIFFKFPHDNHVRRREDSIVEDSSKRETFVAMLSKKQSGLRKLGTFKIGDLGLAVRADSKKDIMEGDAKYEDTFHRALLFRYYWTSFTCVAGILVANC